MSTFPVNKTFEHQQKRLVRSTFKKGFISAIHANSNSVDVSFAENPMTVVRNIRIAKNLPLFIIRVGQQCRVDVFDETNPNDCVLAYTY